MNGDQLRRRDPSRIGGMFSRIACGYDLMNSLMTAGMDASWRRALVRACELPPCSRVLDIGTGTGELALEMVRKSGPRLMAGCDISWEMMEQGRGKAESRVIQFTQANALDLPYPDDCFDAVVSAFVMRNVSDQLLALHEQVRILKPGGKVLFLDIVSPKHSMFPAPYHLLFFRAVPLLGRIVTGSASAYSYLPHSTLDYPSPIDLLTIMFEAGLKEITFSTHCLATISIHIGIKRQSSAP